MRLRGQRENKNEVTNREKKKKISYHMVGRIKTVSFWARLQEMGEERMSRTVCDKRSRRRCREMLGSVKKGTGRCIA